MTRASHVPHRKRAAVEREDYDMAKALKGDIDKLRTAAETANPLAAPTIIAPSRSLDDVPVGRAAPSGEVLPVPADFRASIEDFRRSIDPGDEPVILPGGRPDFYTLSHTHTPRVYRHPTSGPAFCLGINLG